MGKVGLTWLLFVAVERAIEREREDAWDYLACHLHDYREDVEAARAEFYGGGDGTAGRLA